MQCSDCGVTLYSNRSPYCISCASVRTLGGEFRSEFGSEAVRRVCSDLVVSATRHIRALRLHSLREEQDWRRSPSQGRLDPPTPRFTLTPVREDAAPATSAKARASPVRRPEKKEAAERKEPGSEYSYETEDEAEEAEDEDKSERYSDLSYPIRGEKEQPRKEEKVYPTVTGKPPGKEVRSHEAEGRKRPGDRNRREGEAEPRKRRRSDEAEKRATEVRERGEGGHHQRKIEERSGKGSASKATPLAGPRGHRSEPPLVPAWSLQFRGDEPERRKAGKESKRWQRKGHR